GWGGGARSGDGPARRSTAADMSTPLTVLHPRDTDHGARVRDGVRVELITIVWMVLEAAVALGAGIAARSILLTAFGLDSGIELVSAGALWWRLRTEARGG